MPALREKFVTSLYVCGNSYSATSGLNAYSRWPGMLSRRAGFPYIQANNKAVGGAGLYDTTNPPKPGLRTQVRSFGTASKTKAVLVIWLFPSPTERTAIWIPVYTDVMDMAVRQMGFRMVLMPNYPDVTKTAYALQRYTAIELAAIRATFIRFNASYNTMVIGWRNRYRDVGARFAVVDMFNLWDAKGTVPDGLHPNTASHQLFTFWFWSVIYENFLPP